MASAFSPRTQRA
jgi:hypothetical protein